MRSLPPSPCVVVMLACKLVAVKHEGVDMNVQEISAEVFLAELFEFECCELCEGDVPDHVAAPDMFDDWHAWCLDGED